MIPSVTRNALFAAVLCLVFGARLFGHAFLWVTRGSSPRVTALLPWVPANAVLGVTGHQHRGV